MAFRGQLHGWNHGAFCPVPAWLAASGLWQWPAISICRKKRRSAGWSLKVMNGALKWIKGLGGGLWKKSHENHLQMLSVRILVMKFLSMGQSQPWFLRLKWTLQKKTLSSNVCSVRHRTELFCLKQVKWCLSCYDLPVVPARMSTVCC